jgi:hypothetical protein
MTILLNINNHNNQILLKLKLFGYVWEAVKLILLNLPIYFINVPLFYSFPYMKFTKKNSLDNCISISYICGRFRWPLNMRPNCLIFWFVPTNICHMNFRIQNLFLVMRPLQLLHAGITLIRFIFSPFHLFLSSLFRKHTYLIDFYITSKTTLFEENGLLKEHWIFKLGKNNFEYNDPMDPFCSRNPWIWRRNLGRSKEFVFAQDKKDSVYVRQVPLKRTKVRGWNIRVQYCLNSFSILIIDKNKQMFCLILHVKIWKNSWLPLR